MLKTTPAAQTTGGATEYEQLEFLIESSESDIKNMTFAVNTALGQSRRSAEEGMSGLASLWDARADGLRAEIKVLQNTVKDAKSQRRALHLGTSHPAGE